MTKLVTFLGRKSATGTATPSTEPPPATPLAPAAAVAMKADIELDHELFSPIATQLGHENEAVRNLLLDAEHKIGELEIIKRSIGSLVDPVSKTLRAYEDAKNEKLNLQSALNTTRVAHNKLRDEFEAAEKRAKALEAETVRLRDVGQVAQQSIAALERTKAEQLVELTSRRTQIAELQRHAQQLGTDMKLAQDENLKLNERIALADKQMIQTESQAQAAQQKAMQADRERAAVQASLDKSLAELAQTARRLSETDKTLASTQNRLQVVEANLAEAHAERTRLSTALDEANHRHLAEMNVHTSRFEALQARSGLTENLLEEARQTLMARADEIRTFERRVADSSTAHGNTGERLAQVTATLAERDQRIKDLEQNHAALGDQSRLLASAVASRETAHNLAQDKIKEQAGLVQLLESQLKAARDAHEMQMQQMRAQLQREQLERSMAEGALEAGRKDIARLMREVAALQYRPVQATAGEAAAMPQPNRMRSAA